MNKNEVAFLIATIELGNYKKISELRGKLNPDNENEKILINYLDCFEYSSKAYSTK